MRISTIAKWAVAPTAVLSLACVCAVAAGAHVNQQSGMKMFHAPGATGQLVGVYSGAGLEGVASHAGERFHPHFVDSGATVSGHVDRYAVAAGATVKLPVP